MVQLRVKDKAGNYNECMVEVEIQDKTPPIIHCPHDYSIPCSKHIDTVDLQRFGKPDYYDNCIVHMHEYVDTNLNQCGIGHLGRNFVIEDNMGRRDTCRQRIFVYPIDSLDEYDIIWPRDTVIYSCGANLEPKIFLKVIIILNFYRLIVHCQDLVLKIMYLIIYKIHHFVLSY